MKYLFIDIECADGGKATICSFGYVIADMDFRIIKREDIIMNPEGKFYLTGRAGRPDVELAYPKERFKMAPSFPHFHRRIKELVENPDFLVVGHSVNDDVTYLNKACRRYKLEPFSFEYFDTQRMYKELSGDKKPISLENALLSLGVNEKFRSHQSVEDARATMLLLKSLLERAKMTIEVYKNSTNRCAGRTHGGTSRWDYISPASAKKHLAKAEDEASSNPNSMHRGRKRHEIFRRYVECGEAIGERSDKLKDKKVSISMNYESEHFKEMLILAGMIKAAGGAYEIKASDSDIFATFDLQDEGGAPRHCSRLGYVNAAIAEDKKIEIITLKDLLAILGTSFEELESMPELDTEYLLDDKYNKK
jgi:DNA polymerase III epsilon subunit-like protein